MITIISFAIGVFVGASVSVFVFAILNASQTDDE